MAEEGFEAIDHTADLGLRVRAGDLEELYRQAACGLASLVTDPTRISRQREVTIEVSGIDLEELLVAWLGEIIFRFEADQLLLTEFERPRILRDPGNIHLVARAWGDRWDPNSHPIRSAVKAATYHDLRIVPDRLGRFDVTIIFDT